MVALLGISFDLVKFVLLFNLLPHHFDGSFGELALEELNTLLPGRSAQFLSCLPRAFSEQYLYERQYLDNNPDYHGEQGGYQIEQLNTQEVENEVKNDEHSVEYLESVAEPMAQELTQIACKVFSRSFKMNAFFFYFTHFTFVDQDYIWICE